jgi:hypothetical protein
MTSGFSDYEPFTWSDTYNVRVTSANSTFQLARMPWADPVNRVGILRKVAVTNLDGTAAVVHMWDQDQSSTTPTTAGSAGTALVVLGVGAAGASGTSATTAVYGEKDLPARAFLGGISLQCSKINVDVAATIEFR